MACYKYLDASTRFVTPEDRKLLDDGCDNGCGVVSYKYTYGAFVVVPRGIDDAERISDLSSAFWALMRYAEKEGCLLVKLDCDGDELPGSGLVPDAAKQKPTLLEAAKRARDWVSASSDVGDTEVWNVLNDAITAQEKK
jgi:hypothetical protein